MCLTKGMKLEMVNIIFIIIGLFLLIKGADFLIDSSSNIARKFNISEFVIGLTIIAVGTSLPELMISIQLILKGHNNLLIGNVVGSCIYNLLLILGIITIIKPIQIKKESNIVLMLFSILVVGLFGNMYGMITKVEGLILLLFFSIFILSTMAEKTNDKIVSNKSIARSIVFFIIGVILLKIGGDLVVDNATELAEIFNISEKIIGITIVALGTSLPELVTSIVAIKKDTVQIAVGNIIGSNIFNLLLVLGVTSLIRPIEFSGEYNFDLIFLVITTLIIIIANLKDQNKKVRREDGILLIVCFVLYNIHLLMT